MIGSLTRSSLANKKQYRSLLAGNEPVSYGAYELISTGIVTGAAANITLSSIPSTYKHLQIRFSVRDNYNGNPGNISLALNGDFGANYNSHGLYGNGSTVTSASNLTGNLFSGNLVTAPSSIMSPAQEFLGGVIDLLDYSNPNKFTTARMIAGFTSSGRIGLYSSTWRNTAVVTQFMLYGANQLMTGSRVSVYGIKG